MNLSLLKSSIFIIAMTTILSCQKTAIQEMLPVSLLSQSQIINGSAVEQTDQIASHTVFINNARDGYVCTGTIIGKNLVVTAAHCLNPKHNQYEIIFGLNGYDIMDQEDRTSIRQAQKVVVHEDYKEDEEANQNDIGLIYFKGELPEGYSPAEVFLNEDPVKKDSEIILAGYGVTKVTVVDVKYKKSKKFQEEIQNGNVICDFDVLDSSNLPTCFELDMSGDGELRKTTAPVAYKSESEFVLNETNSGSCSGDSGGPAYIQTEGRLYLVGITSRGNLSCDSRGVYTSISAHIDWLLTH